VRTRIVVVAIVVALAFAGGVVVGRWRTSASVPATSKGAPEIIVALDTTKVPIGSRQLFPIFWRGDGHVFELQLRVTASGDAATGKLPEPASTFDIVVHEPGGTKRYLDKRGPLARGAPGVRATDIVADAQTNPPMAPQVELAVTFVYEAPAGHAETLEVEIAPVTGRDVTGASADVRVYELASP
jgi:hypothetical protein